MPYPLLVLQIRDAKGLPAKDTVIEIKTQGVLAIGAPIETYKSANPFAKAIYLNKKGKVLSEEKTEVIARNVNPIWGWNSTPFSGDHIPDTLKKKLQDELTHVRIEVWDKGLTGESFLGKIDIPIDKQVVEIKDASYPLEPRKKGDKDISGNIRIDLLFKAASIVEKERREEKIKAEQEASAKQEEEEKIRINAIIERENQLKAEQEERQKTF